MNKLLSIIIILALYSIQSHAQKGFFVGANVFGYKSNFYNPADLEADKKLDYKLTLNGSFGAELGYRFNASWALSIEPQSTRNAQKYVGEIKDRNGGGFTEIFAETKATLQIVKIPLYLQHTTSSSKKMKWTYTLGAYYGQITQSTEDMIYTYVKSPQSNRHLIVKDKRYDVTFITSNTKEGASLEESIYKKHLFGLSLGSGFTYALSKQLELGLQLKSDYSLQDIENKAIIKGKEDITNDPINLEFFNGFYSKYSEGTNRPDTHLFNLGVALNLRYYFAQAKTKK